MMAEREELIAAYESMRNLKNESTLIDFQAQGNPPDTYLVVYRCYGMVDPEHVSDRHLVRIYLPAEYPLVPPKVTFLSMIFHPNIVAPLQSPSVLREIQQSLQKLDEDERKRAIEQIVQNPKLHEGHVCLDILDLNWSPDIGLDEVCIELGRMIQYKLKNAVPPQLNPAAAAWARQNEHRLPIDRRELRDLDFPLEIISEETVDVVGNPPYTSAKEDTNDYDIEIL